MKIIKSKETLVLTQTEKAILSKARAILDDIYDDSEDGGDIETFADEATNRIEDLLDCAEIEGDAPSEGVIITLTI